MTDPRQKQKDIDSMIIEATPYAYNYARLLCHRYRISVDDSEDIAQEALLRLYSALCMKISEERNILHLRAYTMTIVKHVCLNSIRQQRKEDTSSFENLLAQGYDVQEADTSSPECLIEAAETRRELLQLMSQLPETYHTVASLYFLEGQTVREIADRLGLSYYTVKSQIYRCREKLSEQVLRTRYSGGK